MKPILEYMIKYPFCFQKAYYLEKNNNKLYYDELKKGLHFETGRDIWSLQEFLEQKNYKFIATELLTFYLFDGMDRRVFYRIGNEFFGANMNKDVENNLVFHKLRILENFLINNPAKMLAKDQTPIPEINLEKFFLEATRYLNLLKDCKKVLNEPDEIIPDFYKPYLGQQELKELKQRMTITEVDKQAEPSKLRLDFAVSKGNGGYVTTEIYPGKTRPIFLDTPSAITLFSEDKLQAVLGFEPDKEGYLVIKQLQGSTKTSNKDMAKNIENRLNDLVATKTGEEMNLIEELEKLQFEQVINNNYTVDAVKDLAENIKNILETKDVIVTQEEVYELLVKYFSSVSEYGNKMTLGFKMSWQMFMSRTLLNVAQRFGYKTIEPI